MQALYLLAGFASIPLYYHRVTTSDYHRSLLRKVQISNELVAEMAAERGLSLTQYATYRIIVNTVSGADPIGASGFDCSAGALAVVRLVHCFHHRLSGQMSV